MIDAGIHCDDVLVVDRSLVAQNDDIIVANLNQSFTVRKLELSPTPRLLPMNRNDTDYQADYINDDTEFEIFGVVTYVIHAVR